ncbi:winged helix-turn-helix domain-containing protein [Achromobacter sp. NFACC18-2]|uniref:winged helix-turn-helix domain-containing protein n=1 Tax=Achromobacter sp. NFACC18-2 TaxID=1564112 RepID=UPI0020C932A7|nr:winged helix-turn-helix domain-containing protein [Achromobacter sp. NFACC18-2]
MDAPVLAPVLAAVVALDVAPDVALDVAADVAPDVAPGLAGPRSARRHAPAGDACRIQTPARRRTGAGHDPADGWWSLLYWGWTLQMPSGARLDLTEIERACFACLVKNPRRELVRDELKAIRSGLNMRSLNVAICRLRGKVRQAGLRLPLHTVHGVGYAFLGNLRELSTD